MFNKRKHKGQSTVEYIVLVTAVIAVLIAFLVSPGSPFKASLNTTLVSGTSQMENMADRLEKSTPPSP